MQLAGRYAPLKLAKLVEGIMQKTLQGKMLWSLTEATLLPRGLMDHEPTAAQTCRPVMGVSED